MPKHQNIEIHDPPTADELRKAQAGLLTIQSVLQHVKDPNRQSNDLEDKLTWHSWLTLTGEFGEYAKQHDPPIWDTIFATGVSVVALPERSYFYLQYSNPGEKEPTRRTTKIPLDGILPPKGSTGANSLWWWDSPHYIEILERVERAVLKRLSGYESFMIDTEAIHAARAAWKFARRCLTYVNKKILDDEMQLLGDSPAESALRMFDSPKAALNKCAPHFAKFGIDLPTLIRGITYPSLMGYPPIRMVDPNTTSTEPSFEIAAFEDLYEKQNASHHTQPKQVTPPSTSATL